MNYTKIFKRETKVIAYVVICLTLVVMGVSYALFLQVNNNNSNQVVTAGSLEITYANGNVVTVPEEETLDGNCLMPQDDNDGMGSGGCEFSLSITNNGTLPMQYNLLIYDDGVPSGGSAVPHEYIRHSLNKQIGETTTTVTDEAKRSLASLTLKDGKRIMDQAVIAPNETIVFYLKIWIDENAPSEDDPSEGVESIIGKYVYLKLDVSGLVFENEAATVALLASQESNGLSPISSSTTYVSNDIMEYRFTGADPKNYVYFNCTDSTQFDTCEKWRMLGIYSVSKGSKMESQIKLVKSTSEELKAWDINSSKDYSVSSLNSYLSNDYYDSLSTSAKGQIDKTNYRLGGTDALNISGLEMYGYEVSSVKVVSSPVGLMNVSDYVFAGSVNEEDMIDTIASKENWLKADKDEWLVNSDTEEKVYSISSTGSILSTIDTNTEKLIRPVVYLDSDVKIIGGDGTNENPYVLSK